MLKGIVKIREAIKGTGITFPACAFMPIRNAEIARVEIEAESGEDIQVMVHFTSVASDDTAIAMAQEVATEILDRLGFHFDIAIQDRQMTEVDLNPVKPTPGVLTPKPVAMRVVGQDLRFVRGEQPETIVNLLSKQSSPGVDHYGLHRSARRPHEENPNARRRRRTDLRAG